MNSHNGFEEDSLRNYIQRESIEKAPEDFTSDVMSRITAGVVAERKASKVWHRINLPVIMASIIILLIISAFVFNNHEATKTDLISRHIPEIDISILVGKIDYFLNLNIPAWLPYLAVCILFLVVIDKALNRAFHKESF